MGVMRDFIDSQFASDRSTEVGIGGFTTLARVRERILRTSTVPTTYLEDGTSIGDHIIRNPLLLRIEGSVTDIHVRPSRALDIVKRVQSGIGGIVQYLPTWTATQQNKINAFLSDLSSQIDKIDDMIREGQQLSGFLGMTATGVKTLQRRFLDEMEGHYASDNLISIDMPYRRYDNLRITSLEVERDNEFNALRFSIEAQQIQFAQSFFEQAVAAANPSFGLDGAVDSLRDKGIQEGRAAGASILRKVASKISFFGGQ